MNSVWPGTLAIILYLITSAALTLRLTKGKDAVSLSRGTVLSLGLAAVALHAATLYPDIITASGLNLGFFNAASLIALLSVLLLLLASFKQPMENLGIPVLPIAAATVGLAILFRGEAHSISSGSWKLDMHILFSVLAYSVLALAAVQAALLAIQETHLRNRRPGGFIRALPPMQVMEQLLFQMIGSGFALLSAALLTGIFFLEDIFAQHLVHKTILSIIAWLVFGILLWGRWRHGWRGRTAIRWSLTGFIVLLLAYFGSKFVLELVLQRTV